MAKKPRSLKDQMRDAIKHSMAVMKGGDSEEGPHPRWSDASEEVHGRWAEILKASEADPAFCS